jgi:hypothetical protein
MFISFNADPSLMPYELRRRAWQHAREEARAAYRWWIECEEGPERRIAFAVYRAAEEREAAAAEAFGVG